MTFTSFAMLALASGLLLFPATAWLRRLGVIDVPNERSSHRRPVVRGGGAVMVLVIVIALLANPALRGIVVPLLALATVSFVDDLRSVGAGWRLVVHFAAAGMAFAFDGGDRLPSTVGELCAAAVALFWVVGYTNAFNFMDGINGLAAGQAVVAGLGTALLAWRAGLPMDHPGVVLAMTASAAALGFWPHNFPRARVFMGDVGSASLGFLLALALGLIARDADGWTILALGAMHTNFMLDTAITLMRRIALGKRWAQAHREHFYQLMLRSGRSHTQVTLAEMGLQCGALVVLSLTLSGPPWIRVLAVALVVTTWIAFFACATVMFRESGAAPIERVTH